MSDPSVSPEPPAFAQRPKKPPRSTRLWLVLAIVLTAIWSFVSSFRPLSDGGLQGGPERTAFALGSEAGGLMAQVLICAGVVWLILYFGFTRRLARGRGAAHFGALALTALLAAAPMTALKTAGAFAPGTPPEVSRIMEDHEQRLAEKVNYIEADRDVLLMDAPFSPYALAAPGGVARGRRTVAQLDEVLGRIETAAIEEGARTRAALEAVDMSDSQRERVLKEFDEGLAAGLKDHREEAALAREGLAAVDAQMVVLARTPRGWTLENGALAFHDQTDLKDYNAAVQQAQEAQARLNARETKPAANGGPAKAG